MSGWSIGGSRKRFGDRPPVGLMAHSGETPTYQPMGLSQNQWILIGVVVVIIFWK
tara:strand:+ start:255 stop:419 length:165 start_codon:yes stop_codon:yes gene_type:complete